MFFSCFSWNYDRWLDLLYAVQVFRTETLGYSRLDISFGHVVWRLKMRRIVVLVIFPPHGGTPEHHIIDDDRTRLWSDQTILHLQQDQKMVGFRYSYYIEGRPVPDFRYINFYLNLLYTTGDPEDDQIAAREYLKWIQWKPWWGWMYLGSVVGAVLVCIGVVIAFPIGIVFTLRDLVFNRLLLSRS